MSVNTSSKSRALGREEDEEKGERWGRQRCERGDERSTELCAGLPPAPVERDALRLAVRKAGVVVRCEWQKSRGEMCWREAPKLKRHCFRQAAGPAQSRTLQSPKVLGLKVLPVAELQGRGSKVKTLKANRLALHRGARLVYTAEQHTRCTTKPSVGNWQGPGRKDGASAVAESRGVAQD